MTHCINFSYATPHKVRPPLPNIFEERCASDSWCLVFHIPKFLLLAEVLTANLDENKNDTSYKWNQFLTGDLIKSPFSIHKQTRG